MKKRVLSFLTAAVLFVGTISTGVSAGTPSAAPALAEVNSEIAKTADYIAGELRKSGGDNELSIEKYSYIFYLQRSGIECDDLVNKYLELVSQNITADGRLLFDGSESTGFYSMILLIMGLADVDASNFNGVNLVKAFEARLNADNYDTYYDGSSYTYTYNPIELSYAIHTVKAYSHKLGNTDAILSKLKTALLNTFTEESAYDGTKGFGVDNYGINPDNNSKVLSALKYFYTDESVKATIDRSISWTKDRIIDDGTSLYQYVYNGHQENPNSSATGLTLALLAAYRDADTAILSYYGSISYKSTSIEGAFGSYPYSDSADFDFSSKDIMEGLLSYSRMLSGKTSLYDITDVFAKVNSPVAVKVNNPDALPKDSVLTVQAVPTDNEKYTLISNALKGISSTFTVYDFSLILNNQIIPLDSPVSLTLDIPQGYDNPAIYYVDDQGSYTKLEASAANGKITFTASHFSTYVIVNEAKAAVTVAAVQTPAPVTADHSPITWLLFSTFLSLAIILYSRKCKFD